MIKYMREAQVLVLVLEFILLLTTFLLLAFARRSDLAFSFCGKPRHASASPPGCMQNTGVRGKYPGPGPTKPGTTAAASGANRRAASHHMASAQQENATNNHTNLLELDPRFA